MANMEMVLDVVYKRSFDPRFPVKITERKTKRDWAYFLEEIAAEYENKDARTKLKRLYPTLES